MNVNLTPELEELINKKLESGMYHSASEVIHEGLMLLKECDSLRELRLEELRKEVKKGFDQIEQGEFTTYSSGKELSEQIKAEGRRRVSEPVKTEG